VILLLAMRYRLCGQPSNDSAALHWKKREPDDAANRFDGRYNGQVDSDLRVLVPPRRCERATARTFVQPDLSFVAAGRYR
jgi:hypothetical protein